MVEKVSFAGDVGKGISGKMPSETPDKSMSSGGPIQGLPKTNQGAIAPTGNVGEDGMPPKGGNIVFAGDVGKK